MTYIHLVSSYSVGRLKNNITPGDTLYKNLLTNFYIGVQFTAFRESLPHVNILLVVSPMATIIVDI